MSKKSIKQETPSNIYIFPIAFVITIVPLIVYMKAVKLSPIEIDNWFGKPTYADFFNYYKSQWLIVGSVMALIFFLVHGIIKSFNLKKSFIYIPSAVYALFIVISTICSRDAQVAVNGFVAHNEGMLALLSYLSLFLVTYNLVRTESQIRFLLGALLISASIIGILGILQFLGLDLFRTDFGKRLILPNEYHKMADSVSFKFEESMIFSTLSNPNYIGSYTALLIPIAFSSFICFKKTYLKVGAALLTVVLVVCLIGSRSRAGLVGLAFSVIVALIIFRKLIFKRKLITFISIAGALIIFFGANFALKGVLIDRILAEFNPESQVNQFFDLQDIIFEENRVLIVSSTEMLVIEKEDNYIAFYDGEGAALKYTSEKNENSSKIIFEDKRYKNYVLVVENDIIAINQKHVNFLLKIKEDSFSLIGINRKEINQIEKADSIGFEGNERLGSARGYIWSRTIPMLIKSPVWGYGPDMFVIEFPQGDYIGKIRAYGTAQMIVDKPHNMFLQIAFNSGVPALIALLVLLGFYMIQSIKLYMKDMNKNYIRLMGSGIFLAICGYSAAGLFNDSTVTVAPIFWVLLGLGFVCNSINKKEFEASKAR